MMTSQIWWYADTDMNFVVMVERYQMILDMRDTDRKYKDYVYGRC